MIKNNKTNLKDAPPASIDTRALERLVDYGNPDKVQLIRTIEMCEGDITSIQNNRRNIRESINRSWRDIHNGIDRERMYKNDKKVATKRLAAIDDSETRTKFATMLSNISKLRYVDDVSVDGAHLTVRTRLIFTDVRKASGSRDYTRRCLGAFDIVIKLDETNFSIKNTLFTRQNNPHWTVGSRGNPCHGEHSDLFIPALEEKEYYSLLEYIFAFLRSTDDGAAYMPSNNWIDERNERYGSAATPQLRKGNYVLVHSAYQQYNPSEHCQLAKIIRCDYGNLYIEYKDAFEFGHNLRGLCEEGKGYRVPMSHVYKITKKEFDGNITASEIQSRNPLDELDSLPYGSTLTDAKKII